MNEAYKKVGIRHYSLLYGPGKRINISTLRQLCDKYLRSQIHEPKHCIGLSLQDVRRCRPDAMAHFPFSDDSGTMPDILRQDWIDEDCHLLSMGKPGRKKFIAKTFEEMRLDNAGIRLRDLPEALHRLGIFVPDNLRLYLLETRNIYNRDGSLRNYDELSHSYTREVFVSLTQFEKIIQTSLLLRDHTEMEDVAWLVEILREDSNDNEPVRNPLSSSGREPANRKAHRDDENDDVDSLCNSSEASIEESKNVRKSKKKTKEAPKRVITDPTHSSRMKQVPSKIGGIVRADRKAFEKAKSHTEQSALAALARRRVDLLTSMKGPPDNYSPQDFPVGPSPKLSVNVRSEKQQISGSERQRLRDLSSGRSMNEIAESFISSSVGKELMNNSTVNSNKVTSSSGYNHERVADKMSRSVEEKELKGLYKGVTNWKSSRSGGGWVADFGPAHTQASYAGPSRRGDFIDGDSKPWRDSGRQSRSSNRVNDTSNIVDEDEGGFGVNDSFLVKMSREIEDMKREKEVDYQKEKASIAEKKQLNYFRQSSKGHNVNSPSDDDAVVGAGEGFESVYDENVLYGSTYAYDPANQMEDFDSSFTDGTPRSKNLLNVLQNTISLREVAQAAE